MQITKKTTTSNNAKPYRENTACLINVKQQKNLSNKEEK